MFKIVFDIQTDVESQINNQIIKVLQSIDKVKEQITSTEVEIKHCQNKAVECERVDDPTRSC